MQLGSQCTKKEFRNLTFAELENLVNLSSVTIQDHEVLFMNQVQEINKIFAQVGNNDRMCEEINRKLNYMRHWQQIIELNISVTNKMLHELECKIVNLEGEDPVLNCEKMDPLRSEVYPIALQLNSTMMSLIQKYEEVLSQLITVYQNEKGDQSKMVKQILDHQLNQLEHLEIMMHKVSKEISDINSLQFDSKPADESKDTQLKYCTCHTPLCKEDYKFNPF